MEHPSTENPSVEAPSIESQPAEVAVVQEFMDEKTWKSETWKAVSIFTIAEYKAYSIKDKVLYGLISPIFLWMRLSVPIIDENDMNKSWNKPLSIIQVCKYVTQLTLIRAFSKPT